MKSYWEVTGITKDSYYGTVTVTLTLGRVAVAGALATMHFEWIIDPQQQEVPRLGDQYEIDIRKA